MREAFPSWRLRPGHDISETCREPVNNLLDAGEATLWIYESGDLAFTMKRPDDPLAGGIA